jgi:putative acetyltransferase
MTDASRPASPVHHWRAAIEADLPALAALYRDAARTLGPRVYTPEQVAAWMRAPDDAPAFRAWILDADTELACDAHDAPLGFCGISATGHVHSLYVRPDCARRGIGTTLLERAIARARERAPRTGAAPLDAWVTPFSRPVFLRLGFLLTETVQAPFQGVTFERYRVTRS